MTPEVTDKKEFALPLSILGAAELNRIYRELELLDDFLRQDTVRSPGQQLKMPSTTRVMDEFCRTNEVNMLDEAEREAVKIFLKKMKKSAPVVHISFAVEASPAFITKILRWIRENIHPHALLQVGMTPSIVGGCIVRTTNQVFNFGLKQKFDEHKSLLQEQIRTLG